MKIKISGGLGNQLFQFAFAHYASNIIDKTVYYEVSDEPNFGRPFELAGLIGNCTHRLQRVDSKGPLAELIRIPALISGSKWIEPPTYEFILPERVVELRNRKIAGYFQNWKFLFPENENVVSEISNYVNGIDLPSVEFREPVKGTEYLLIHIRGGDLLLYEQTMGCLSEAYYLDVIGSLDKKSFSKIVVTTDDKKFVIENFRRLKYDYLFDQLDLTTWECLKLMSNAKILITANSTLSWWGGCLASRGGSQVHVPNPWFKKWHENPGAAFLVPDFIPHNSRFEL